MIIFQQLYFASYSLPIDLPIEIESGCGLGHAEAASIVLTDCTAITMVPLYLCEAEISTVPVFDLVAPTRIMTNQSHAVVPDIILPDAVAI